MKSEPNFEYVGAYHRYIARANKLYEGGDTTRAEAFGAIGSAFQLFPPRGDRGDAPRGEYFGPMASGGFGELPNMAFIRRAETIACLRSRMTRYRNPFRRARIADTVWEFAEQPDPEAARIAADAYLDGGAKQIVSEAEFAPMMGASAIARSLSLALAINDRDRVARAVGALVAAVEQLAGRDEHVALFRVIEALLPRANAASLERADEALDAHLRRLQSRDADNFHFREGVLELQINVARRRGLPERVRTLERMKGETIAAEAAWKGSHYDNGGLVAMHFYAKAADHFDKIGDHQRANELRKMERAAYSDTHFSSIRGSVDIDVTPFRDALTAVLAEERGREVLWAGLLRLLPLPTTEAIIRQQEDWAQHAPLLSMVGVSTVRPEGVLEEVPAEEATRRRAESFAYEQHGALVTVLVRLALDEHSVGPTAAGAVLKASGLFDDTSEELLGRVLRALEARDWMTAAYLTGPLFERVVRAIAVRAGAETMYTDRQGGRPRRLHVPIEALLRRIPLSESTLAYVRWVTTHPGLNVRNEAGHGLLETSACTERLGAHLLYALVALALGDVVMVAEGA